MTNDKCQMTNESTGFLSSQRKLGSRSGFQIKFGMTLLWLFAFFVMLSFCVTAQELPNYSGFVNDYASTLDLATKVQIEQVCTNLKSHTGAEIAVAIVNTTAPLDSKTYAVKLFDKWGIGQKGKDNGVLFLVAVVDRRVEIEVGYGLEGILNDAKVGQLLDNYVIPYFSKGNFADGTLSGVQAIAKVIDDNFLGKKETQASNIKAPDKTTLYAFAIIGAIAIFSMFFRGGAGRGVGAIIGAIFGFFYMGSIVGAIIGAILGLLFGMSGGTFLGGGGGFSGGVGGGGGGGGFGGFGGGSSGGGGSGRNF